MTPTSKAVAVALALVVAIAFLIYGPRIFTPFTNQNNNAIIKNQEPTITMNENPSVPRLTQEVPNPLPSDLFIKDIVVGSGPEAKNGDLVSVHYVGAFPDGTVFDSSLNRAPFSLQLGAGMVISGWEQGLVGMKEGGKRQLVIPGSLAYGERGAGPIPPNATLVFEVELLSVSQGR